jgi:hypothetical protein
VTIILIWEVGSLNLARIMRKKGRTSFNPLI